MRRPFASLVVAILAGCAHHEASSTAVLSLAGSYRAGVRWGDHHHEFMAESQLLELGQDGRYVYDLEWSEYGRVQSQRHTVGRWTPVPGGVRLQGGGPLSNHFAAVFADGNVYLVDDRQLASLCKEFEPKLEPSTLHRQADAGSAARPTLIEVCAAR